MKQLDDFFDAYDQTHELAGEEPDWQDLRKRVRKALARPVWELAGQIIFVLAALIWGIFGHPIGYFLAIGELCFLPGYVQRVRMQSEGIASLSDDGELRHLLKRESTRQIATAIVGALYWAAIALLLFFLAGLLAWMEKDFRPSLIVGGIAVGLCAFEVFFRLPRYGRGMADWDDAEENESDEREEEHAG